MVAPAPAIERGALPNEVFKLFLVPPLRLRVNSVGQGLPLRWRGPQGVPCFVVSGICDADDHPLKQTPLWARVQRQQDADRFTAAAHAFFKLRDAIGEFLLRLAPIKLLAIFMAGQRALFSANAYGTPAIRSE